MIQHATVRPRRRHALVGKGGGLISGMTSVRIPDSAANLSHASRLAEIKRLSHYRRDMD